MSFSELRKNLKKDYTGFPKIKIAITGDTPTQFLHQAIRGYGYKLGLDCEIYEADYDQVDMQVFDASSELYSFQPDYIIIFQATQKMLGKFYKKNKEQKTTFAGTHLQHVNNICDTLNERLKTKIIYCNLPEIPDMVFGNFAAKTTLSFTYQLRKINLGLMELAGQVKNLYIADFSSLQNVKGRDAIYSPQTYTNTGIVYDIEFWPLAAKNILDTIQALRGKFHKAVVLDLDNTTWGGIIGDDGLENIQIGDLGIGKAFTELQAWMKQLKQRGIILTVCSKNYESVAKEVFEKHPDMVLRLDDIAVFVANWENKVDNIRYIQSVLNIGFDSMVYLDDNPFERNMVRQEIPQLTIPELPEDPAEYLGYLFSLNLFETASISAEDESRTQQYQEEAKRVNLQKAYTNEDDFLQSLDMKAEVKPFDKFYTPRIAQLSQRSNQFNLRTVRYTEQDIEAISQDKNYLTLYFTLEDKYGEYGLISLVILKKEKEHLFIETWLMSCRVLKRGMEKFVLNNIIQLAKENGFDEVVGEYIPTEKNALVKEHYSGLGFTPRDNYWVMKSGDYKTSVVYINKK